MARYAFPALSEVGPSGLHRVGADKLMSASYDDTTGIATVTIGKYDPRIVVSLVHDRSNGYWASAKVTIPTDTPHAALIGRLNRIMGGFTGWPRVETYRRGGGALDGKVVVRMPADPQALPQTIFGADLGSMPVWSLLGAPRGSVSTPTPPPAPAPAAPKAAPTPVAPKPEPPKAKRSDPIVVNAPKHDPLGLLRFPTKATTNDIIASDDDHAVLESFIARHMDPQRDGMSALLLTGPAGTGKTQMVDYLAAKYGFGVFDANAMGAIDLSDWAGRTGIDPDTGGTHFVWTSLIEVIRADGKYAGIPRAVKVDEFNRTPSTAAGNFWLPVTEEGRVYVPEAGIVVDIDPKVMFFFTVNEGAGYSGTVDIDTALRDRMDDNVRLDYLTNAQEVDLIMDRMAKKTGITRTQAKQVVNAATQVRQMASQREVRSGISTRNILKVVEKMAYGRTLRSAALSVWVNSYPDEAQRERVTTAVNASITD